LIETVLRVTCLKIVSRCLQVAIPEVGRIGPNGMRMHRCRPFLVGIAMTFPARGGADKFHQALSQHGMAAQFKRCQKANQGPASQSPALKALHQLRKGAALRPPLDK
jgi:hypothetical protein